MRGACRGRRLRQAWLLLLLAGPLAGPARGAELEDASHVDILLVGDTTDATIKDGVWTDLARMRSVLEMGVPAARRTVTVLADEQATVDAIRGHYEARRARADETRVFYFAGHGVWNEAGPDLRLPGGSTLPRNRLRAWIGRGEPRLVVLLTDCCSAYVGMAAMARRMVADPDTFRDLLFRHRGVVDVTAAKAGQAAVGNGLAGGYFTTGIVDALTGLLREELDEDHSGIVTWKEALSVVTSQTESTFDLFHPEGLVVGGRLQRDQSPLVLGTPAESTGQRIPRSKERLGVTVQTDPAGGARITAVAAGTPAAWSGLLVGERIRGLGWTDRRGEPHDHEIAGADDLRSALAGVPGPALVTLLLEASTGAPEVTPRDVLVRLAR